MQWLTQFHEGRTGRIGNIGLATSFYNERDVDLAEALVKTMLETHQIIPDFLESYIPEGFTADGTTGDVNALKFEADSDNGETGENAGESFDAQGAWGVNEDTSSGWGPASVAVEQPGSGGGWGQQVQVTQVESTRGAQPVVHQPTPIRPAAPVNSWNVPAPAPQAPVPSNQNWGPAW